MEATSTGAATATIAADPMRRKVSGYFNDLDSTLVDKTVLVDLMMERCPGQSLRVCAILDKQSDATLIDNAALDFFGRQFPSVMYDLVPADASNIIGTVGRQVSGLKVKGVLNNSILNLKEMLSINKLTDSRAQVTTPQMALMHKHTASCADQFPSFNSNAQVALLLVITMKELSKLVCLCQAYILCSTAPALAALLWAEHVYLLAMGG